MRWRWDGEPFGGGAVNNNPSGAGVFDFHLRFAGQMMIPETGLFHNYHRDYDPATGRYLQSDPIGLHGGVNTYAYGNLNPISSVDPFGLLVWSNLDRVRPVTPGDYPPIPGVPPAAEDGNSMGFTTADWTIRSECKCVGEGQWEFVQFQVKFILTAYIHPSLKGEERAWALRGEILDHMGDYEQWIPKGQRVARHLENQYKGRTFSTQAQCEATAAALSQALTGSIRSTAVETVHRWDKSDRHT